MSIAPELKNNSKHTNMHYRRVYRKVVQARRTCRKHTARVTQNTASIEKMHRTIAREKQAHEQQIERWNDEVKISKDLALKAQKLLDVIEAEYQQLRVFDNWFLGG